MKQKTRKSLALRIKITKNGKIIRRTQNMRHLRTHKTKKQIRRLKKTKTLQGKLAKKILKMMGVS